MRLKAFQCREWWMQSAVAAAAVAIITNNEEWFFFNFNCLWKVSLVEAGLTAFPDRGIFLTPCAVVCQCNVRHGASALLNSNQGRMFLWESRSRGCCHQHCLCAWEGAPQACDKGITSPIEENSFRILKWEMQHVHPSKPPSCERKKTQVPQHVQDTVLGKGMDFLLLQTSCCSCRAVQRRHYTAQHKAAEQKGHMPWAHCYQIILSTCLSFC